MAKSQATYAKKEKENKRLKKRQEKELKKEERKANAGSSSFESMIAYVDEYGNLSSTPPDPASKSKIKAENIVIGVPKRESGPTVDIIRTGTVTMFSDSKGYGFIKDAETQESIFTHVNEHVEVIRENDRVTFRIEYSHKGPNAVEVKLVVK